MYIAKNKNYSYHIMATKFHEDGSDHEKEMERLEHQQVN